MATRTRRKPSPAYNWHPAVHSEHFEEILTFVMIRLHEPLHRPVAEQIRALLAAANIEYACAYPLFGWWDALVRVWLTVPARKLLTEVLAEPARHNVDDAQAFATSEVRYLWRSTTENLLKPDKDLQALITTNSSKLDSVAASPERTDTAAWRHLKKEGLLFPRPRMPKKGVKFYTALTRTNPEAAPVRQEIDAIMRAMDSTPLGDGKKKMSSRSSLYCGSGELQASYLVRCVANQFDDVLALAESFDMHLEKTRLRPETWIVANPSAVFESDYVNNPRHLSQDDSKTAGLLGIPPEVLAKLSTPDRQALKDLVVEACELADADSDLRERQLAILRASASNDRQAMLDALSFLGPQFEPEFKARLISEFSETFGAKDWLSKIRAMCAESKDWRTHAQEQMSESPKRWTLGTYVKTAQAVASLDETFHGKLTKELGSDWSIESDSAVCLRNDYTHGRVYEMSQYDSYEAIWKGEEDLGFREEPWVAYLRRTTKAAVFTSRIQDKPGRTKGSEDE